MNPKKNQTLLRVFVTVMIIGLVGVYVPMLFSGQTVSESIDQGPPQEAPIVVPTPDLATSTVTSSTPIIR
jgi:hypothetical protein